MTEHKDREIQKLCGKLIKTINEYMDGDDGDAESTKMAVIMSAVTRILAAMTVTVGMPASIAHEALKIEMETVLEAMMNDSETKH